MKKRFWLDAAITLGILLTVLVINMLFVALYDTRTLVPMIFVLGIFLISLKTQGYFWGITSSLISVIAVNYVFTYPYYVIDLISPECLSSAVVMLVVAVLTGMMTTQIKQNEKAKIEAERERMRGNLLRAVSHDLRTPLTAIYGASSTLLDNYQELSPQQHKKLLQDMHTEAQWLVRMVENLLSVTKIHEDKVQVYKNPTVLEELIDTVLLKFRKHYPNQQVQVSIPEEFASIPMDAMLITQVLMNLLENAVFHAKGMQNLTLTVELVGGFARFIITDDGCGIPPERMAGIFTGMQDSRTPADSGRSNMGIGLSVCSAIIRAHGSKIEVQNRPEGGAKFWFTLPMEDDKVETL